MGGCLDFFFLRCKIVVVVTLWEIHSIMSSNRFWSVFGFSLFLWWPHFAQPPRGEWNQETYGEGLAHVLTNQLSEREKAKPWLVITTGWFLWCKCSHYDWFQLPISSDSLVVLSLRSQSSILSALAETQIRNQRDQGSNSNSRFQLSGLWQASLSPPSLIVHSSKTGISTMS